MKNFLTIRIGVSERNNLTAKAKQLGFSRSQLVRNAVNFYLENAKPS